MNQPHIKPLTSLRGVAAAYVFFHHLSSNLLPELGRMVSPSSQLMLNGYLWVDFFFILSGFLLAILYQQRFADNAIATKEFLVRRFSRIYPLHIVILLSFVLYQLALLAMDNTAAFTGRYSLFDLVRNVFLLQAVQLDHTFAPWNAPSWSISAEWLAYILFPLIIAVLYKLKGISSALIFWVLSVASLSLVEAQTSKQLDLTGYLGLLRCVIEFSIGIMLSKGIYNSNFCQKWLANSIAQLALCFALLLSLHLDNLDVLSVLLMAFIIASVSTGNSRFNRVLSHPWLVYLGKISYSIYMVHWLIFTFIKLVSRQMFDINIKYITSLSSMTAISLICIVLVLLASVISFHFIEEPLRKWLPTKLIKTDNK